MQIVEVANPVYSKSDNSTIDVRATFDDGRVLPYTSGASDNEEHGKKLWEELQAGKHGPIAPYISKQE